MPGIAHEIFHGTLNRSENMKTRSGKSTYLLIKGMSFFAIPRTYLFQHIQAYVYPYIYVWRLSVVTGPPQWYGHHFRGAGAPKSFAFQYCLALGLPSRLFFQYFLALGLPNGVCFNTFWLWAPKWCVFQYFLALGLQSRFLFNTF